MRRAPELRGSAARSARAGRAAGRPRRAARGHPHEHHRDGRGRARGVGALGDARPAQLGAPGRRARRRRAPPARRSCCCARAGAPRPRAGRASAACATCAPSARSRTSGARRASCSASAERAARGRIAGADSRSLQRLPRLTRQRLAQLGSLSAMATCYRHPSRETGVSCSNCGRPICPDCMTTTPVGMRCPECAQQRTKVVRLREVATIPRVTYALIVINVVAFLTEQGQFSLSARASDGKVIDEGVAVSSSAAIAEAPRSTGGWSPAASCTRTCSTSASTCTCCTSSGMMLEPAIGSRALRRDLLHRRCSRAPSARCSPPPCHQPRRLGRGVRADGRRRGRAARARRAQRDGVGASAG